MTLAGAHSLAFAPLATGVARLDADLCIVELNPAFAELTGYARSRLLGHALTVLAPAGARLHALAEHARGDGNVAVARNVEVCATPGSETCLDIEITPLDGGALIEVHPAAAPTAGGRVSESLRGFAHEVRNPLAAIAGAAQLLQQGAVDARQLELAGLIREETARLASLTARLLGARNTLATRAVNVHAVLERAAELLHAERTDVVVERDYDPSLPAWQGDPDRLLQAVLNLVRNAVEAEARTLVLRSRAEAGWRNALGQRVPALRIEVDDDGTGIPASLAASLFEPMVSGRPDGSGLGLALAREIAREHGGELSCEPRTRGARFVLRLPRRPPGTGDTAPADANPHIEAESP